MTTTYPLRTPQTDSPSGLSRRLPTLSELDAPTPVADQAPDDAEVELVAEPSGPRELRSYQIEAADAVEAEWQQGYERTSVVLPTGSGKSTVIAEIANRAVLSGLRVVLLAHRRELLEQMSEAVAAVNPDLDPVGIVMGTRSEYEPDIVAASFQTLARSPERIDLLGRRHVVLVDECHHAMAESYLGVLVDFGLTLDDPRPRKVSDQQGDQEDQETDPETKVEFGDHPAGTRTKAKRTPKTPDEAIVKFDSRPPVVACGFTATMGRNDSSRLGEVWNTVSYEKDLLWAIENEYLVSPRGKTVQLPALDDLSSIRNVAGDYNQGKLDEVMRASTGTTVEAINTHARGRAMIVFAASVEHADMLAVALTAAGLRAAAVVGSHSPTEREQSYAEFNDGALDALVTVQVLTEGADFPRCDCVVMARPTRSNVLFSQMVGRALRLYTDPRTGAYKDDALVLDLTGVARDRKLVTLTKLWTRAEVQTFNEQGDEVVEEPPGQGGTDRERMGRADLGDVDLLRPSADPVRDVLVLTTAGGVVFVPSGKGSSGFVLWPPNPDVAPHSYLMKVDPKTGLLPLVDAQGVPARGSFENAVYTAQKLAYTSRTPDGNPGYTLRTARWRGSGVRPSAAQKDLCTKIGVQVTGTMTKADVSDAIAGKFMERTIDKFYGQIVAMRLTDT